MESRTLLTSILVDYSLDLNDFFDTQIKRDVFQAAAESVADRLTDSLSAIEPGAADVGVNNSWTISFTNPATGLLQEVDDPVIAEDTLVIFAGGRDLPGAAAGSGGPGGFSASGTADFLELVASRGQTGALDMPATDFGPWGGSISFDTGTNWHFGLTTDGLESHETDFISVAQHEVAHLLGFGTAASWNTHVSDGSFSGPDSVSESGRDVPLHVDNAHWAAETTSGGELAAMTPSLLNGTRSLFTALDFAALSDIGWTLDTLIPLDYGDAPDGQAGTSVADYQTVAFDDGPAHAVTTSLFLGHSVDADAGSRQSRSALADDVDGSSPGDEDGVTSPFDLTATIGEQPRVTLSATNLTETAASLYGWIDFNQDGRFDNVTERAVASIPDGASAEFFTLQFPEVPDGSAGTTYARFRLSTDVAAGEPTGFAADGEVEDYRVVITRSATTSIRKTVTINSTTAGTSSIDNLDLFGGAVAALGDLNGDGVPDVAVGAYGDDTGGTNRGAVHVLFLNADGTVKSTQLIAHNTGGGPSLSDDDRFGRSLAVIGDIDGDGVVDLAVGADGDSGSGTSRGALYVLFLNTDGTVRSHRRIASSQSGGPALSNGDSFGRSVTGVGDLNGDGVDDVAVGAPYDSSRGPLRGAAYVLFLDTDGSVTSHQKIGSIIGGGPALSDGDRFAISLSSIADVNGDGVVDLAVGADRHDTGGVEFGAVHVLFLNRDGTASSSQTIASGTGGGPDLTIGDRFGSSVADIGDLNGDGIHELAVGAYRDDTGGTDRGAAHILYLNADGTSSLNETIDSSSDEAPALLNHDRFGSSIASIGDLDGDGISELVAGADGDDSGGVAFSERGALHILFLTPPHDYGDAPDRGAGSASDDYRTTRNDNGPAHAIDSRLSLGVTVDADTGSLQDDIANADDVDGAFPDDEDGIVSVLDLSAVEESSPTVAVLVTNSMPIQASLYGWIDYNRDGVFDNTLERADVTIPAASGSARYVLTFPTVPADSAGSTYARFRVSTDVDAADAIGAVDDGEVEDYRFEIQAAGGGYAASSTLIGSTVNGGPVLADGDRFGDALVHLGDVDGDGVPDIAVGAPLEDLSGSIDSNRGAIHVLLLNSDGTVKTATRISSRVNGGPVLADEDHFGASVTSLGDLDADGVVDLLVGAPGDDAEGDQQGAVYVVYLNADGSAKRTLKIADTSNHGPDLLPGDRFGEAATSLGDLDGDGIVDIAVGAPGDDTHGPDCGAVHVLLLNADGTVKSIQKIAHGLNGGPALADNDRFGDAVSVVGDLNGDGVQELAVGAPSDSSVQTGAGAVYVLFMNPDGTVASNTLIAGMTNGGPVLPAFSHFGASLAATGDYDGDGINDLAVGAIGTDASGGVYLLSLHNDGTVKDAQLIASRRGGGPLLNDGEDFGASVSAIGDLNADGITDLAVGAPHHGSDATFPGTIFILTQGPPDTNRPTVSVDILDTSLNDTDRSSTLTFEFSEAVEGFDLTDISAAGGTLASLTQVDSDSFTAEFLADDHVHITGSVTVDGLFSDLAGNDGFGSSDDVAIDTLNPTVAITPEDSSTSDSPIVFTFQFSETVTGFVAGDVNVSNGAVGAFTPVDGDTFTVAVTPASAGDVTVSVGGGAAQDAARNDSVAASATVTFEEDNALPANVTLPGAGSYEVLRDGSDLVVRVAGGGELLRQDVSSIQFLNIVGSAGDDEVTVLDTGTPVDTGIVFTGGDGNDRFDASLAVGNTILTGNGGDDVLIGGSGNDTLNGGSGKDEVIGNAGDDLVQGQGSTGDTLDGGDGNDTLGGDAGDLIRESFAGDATLTNSLMTGRGTDTIIGIGRAMFTGSGAAQRFDLSTFFVPGVTSTILDGGGGDDTILATSGGDIISGAGGSDLIDAGGGDDRVFGGSGADTIAGGNGNDFIKGLGGSGDQLIGGAGNDTLNGGRGVDRLIESGDADFTVTNSSMTGNGADVLLALEIAEINAGDSDNLIDVSAFLGFRGFVQVRANGGNDTIIGSAGPDVLNGGDGNDSLVGGEGDDLLNGDAGNDILQGKEGDDTLNGGDDNDGLSGFTGNDVLNGERGFDRQFGGNGNDTLTGGNARDTLFGGAGDDSLAGNDGDDTLVGGTGNNDASPGDAFDGLASEIDEAFMLDTLPGWVDQV